MIIFKMIIIKNVKLKIVRGPINIYLIIKKYVGNIVLHLIILMIQKLRI